MKVRYTGVGGASVENAQGIWNVDAPEKTESGEPHPFAPIKELDDEVAKKLIRLPHFEAVTE